MHGQLPLSCATSITVLSLVPPVPIPFITCSEARKGALTKAVLNAVVVLAFTLPKAYELKKDEVDKFASQAHHHTKVAYAHAIAHHSVLLFIC